MVQKEADQNNARQEKMTHYRCQNLVKSNTINPKEQVKRCAEEGENCLCLEDNEYNYMKHENAIDMNWTMPHVEGIGIAQILFILIVIFLNRFQQE